MRYALREFLSCGARCNRKQPILNMLPTNPILSTSALRPNVGNPDQDLIVLESGHSIDECTVFSSRIIPDPAFCQLS